MYKLRLKAVDSRNATDEELREAGITPEQIPTGMEIAAHQAATVKALRYGTAPIIINQAMTGDGKTLAGRFQLLSQKWRTFSMYPTNELANDQVQSFDELIKTWSLPNWNTEPDYEVISGQRLDELEGFQDFARIERLELLLQSDYVMTNPDIFHHIMNFGYEQYGAARDLIPATLAAWHRLFIFDEFHLFDVQQICSVLIAILLLQQMKRENEPPRFLFLSATPQKLLKELAERVGQKVEYITGDYVHGRPLMPGYRRILQAVDLNLYQGTLEDWVKEHFDDTIKPFFETHQPAAKGLIVANSVATAHRIYEYLKPLGAHNSIIVEPNTGLVPPSERRKDFDLLVATSTVDVGVDFKINFLVFESNDAASHIQRLGRLGRHTHDKHGRKFEAFEAHAVLPQWVIQGLQENFGDGDDISREKYSLQLYNSFPSQQDFANYRGKWAWIQAVRVLQALNKWDIKQQYQAISQKLEEDYTYLFSERVKKAKKVTKPKTQVIWDVASTFRGGSNFTTLLHDPNHHIQPVHVYNLVTLLRNCELEVLSLEETYRIATDAEQNINYLKRQNPLIAYRLHGWLVKPREVSIYLDAHLEDDNIATELVIESNRFTFQVTPKPPELPKLNDKLEQQMLVTYLIPDEDHYTIRKICRLGFQVELFPFKALNTSGTLAFGRDALLLDVAYSRYLYAKRNKSNKPTIF